MAFYRFTETQLITRVYIVEADSTGQAEDVFERTLLQPVDEIYGDEDPVIDIDGPFDTAEEAS